MREGLALGAALGRGLIGGVFYAFSTFVMKALARRPPAEAIAAMQSINVAVLNRWFLVPFFGTGLLCAAAAVAALLAGPVATAVWTAAGALLYIGGTLGVTMKSNVPRNNALARLAPQDPASAAYWPRYVAEWTAWNQVRTAAALAAAFLYCL
jgi:uncharacterized membrane protein